MLAGDPGFISSPDAVTLTIRGGTLPGDPLEGQLHAGSHIGGLGLAPATRRRNRVNGEIVAADDGSLRIAVMQSFGNCPQYISHRQHTPAPADGRKLQVQRGLALTAADRELIARADTFFIASANLEPDAGRGRGVDVSHRGGRPGFVRIDDDRTLTAPDFVGNFFFNTIGNLLNHPRAGLLFIDFERGDMLHLAVETEIIWDGPQVQAFAGAERLLRFHVREVVRNIGALPFRWTTPQAATQVARTGNWEEAGRTQAAAAFGKRWRPFTVTDLVQESADVRSFHLQPADGLGVAPHLPGQFISLRVPEWAQQGAAGQIRSYTISDAPDGRRYRISVKRQARWRGVLVAARTSGARRADRADGAGRRFHFRARPAAAGGDAIGRYRHHADDRHAEWLAGERQPHAAQASDLFHPRHAQPRGACVCRAFAGTGCRAWQSTCTYALQQ
jgi:predicted pyridoxine 5'-phosphate oxidase superfamily flavin-nucleotide-binding protein